MAMRFTARTIATLPTTTALAALPTPAAQATAIGSSPVATFDYQVGGVTVKVPTGCAFTHIIRGSGRSSTCQNADVDCGSSAR
ncbi:hypothetical protein [Streptomyces hundungensis]|uniref:hypothetical protein n=1 Tax=Streptomyces hundungensis TaxID=1077946 RepID=UPI0033EEE87C